MNNDRHLWEFRWVRDLVIVLVLTGIALAIYQVRSITAPALIGLGLAYVFNPLVTWLHQKVRWPRWLSTIMLMFAGLVISLSLLLYVTPPIFMQARSAASDLHRFVNHHWEADVLPHLRKISQYSPAEQFFSKHDKQPSASESTTMTPDANDVHLEGGLVELTQGISDSLPSTPTTNTLDAQPIAVQNVAAAGLEKADKLASTHHAAVDMSANTTIDDMSTNRALDIKVGDQLDASLTDSELLAPAEKSGETHSSWADMLDTQTMQQITDSLAQMNISKVGKILLTSLNVGAGAISSVVGMAVYLGLSLVIIVVCFFFFSWHFEIIVAWFVPLIPGHSRARTVDIIKMMDATVAAIVRGRLVQATTMGVILSIGWWLAGVPYWLLLGVGCGVLNLIPYAASMGMVVAVVLSAIHAVASGAGFSAGAVVWPAGIFLFAQVFDGWVVEPTVQGKATGLNAITVMLAVMAGGTLAGLLGMLLAIPVAACTKILAKEVILPKMRDYAERQAAISKKNIDSDLDNSIDNA